MWNAVKIEFNNLFSHKSSVYEFKENKCVVVFGENRDQVGQENNGAGKSTLFEAVALALTNESLRGVKKETFINHDEEWCDVRFELTNSVLKRDFVIYRKFFRGGKAVKVEIYENGELNTQITSVVEANKYIYETIGVSRDDLLRYFIISQDNHYTFFTASDADKKEIMNRITSADMVNPILNYLGSQFKEKNDEYNDITRRLDKAVARRDLLLEQKETLLATDDSGVELENLRSELKDIEGKLNKAKSERKKLHVVDVDELKKKRKKIKGEIETLETEISENTSTKRQLEYELDGRVICPKCKHEFIQNSALGLTVKQTQSLIKETDKELEKQRSERDSKNAQVKKLTEQINNADSVNDQIDELDVKIEKYERRKKSTEKEIHDLEDKRNNNSELKELDEKINLSDDEIKSIRATLSPISDELEIIKFWQFYMGRSGFQTYLANKSIKIIEGMTNNYLKRFGVEMRILINGFKVLASGEVREKIDVFVLEDGVTAEAYMGRSGGERGRVVLAGVLAIHKLINMSTEGKGLNLLLLDECFPGMDSLGQENIIKIFDTIGVTSMIITQNVSDGFNADNALRVVKHKGVSRYIQS